MAIIYFYEKPGCGNNTRQKLLLEAAGHDVIACNLLQTSWTAVELRAFFGSRPVAEWFNKAAPRVKSGEVQPDQLDEQAALEFMLCDPLLIRRPLMRVGEQRRVGFDADEVDAWIGLQSARVKQSSKDLESCPRHHGATPCPDPNTARNTSDHA